MTNIVVVGEAGDLEQFLAQASTESVAYIPIDPAEERTRNGLGAEVDMNGNGEVHGELHAVVILDPAATGVLDTGIQTLLDAGDAELPLLLAVPYLTATTVRSEIPGDNPVAAFSWVAGGTDLREQVEYSVALQSTDPQREVLSGLLEQICPGTLTEVEDRVAHVSMRILMMIINEAAFAVQEGVASPADIDTAMKLGTSYPIGPLEWCDRIGAEVVVAILDGLQMEYGEERYRPAVLLRQYARASRPFFESARP